VPATLDDRALNRALLARQHLLERTAEPLVDVVEAIGAMQGQAWGALPVGLWSRLASFAPADLYRALELGELRWGIGIRGTLHLVSSVEHPVYAVVSEAGWTGTWHRAIEETTPGMYALRFALLDHAATPRTNEELRAFAEAWVAEHPGEIDPRELDAQRALSWRPIYRWSALTRVPSGGVWGSKAPADHLAAPVPPGSEGAPRLEEALEALALRHLGAFGPAAAEDVATWVGWRTPPVRDLLDGLGGRLRRFEDVHGRTLYDLADAPLPDADTPAPPRFLGAFDSSLLAYASKRRERIVPEALRDVVYERKNLQVKPAFLVDGLVAGIWSSEVKRKQATLTLQPGVKLAKRDREGLATEGEGLLRALYPAAIAHRVEGC
jgi:hypothetical protein